MPFANTSSGSVYYPSQIVSRQVCPDWDPLGYFISAARRRGLQVWPAVCVLASGHFEPHGILIEHPEWALRQTDGRPWGFISPAHPEARAWLVSWIDELVSRYEPDGLLLDYLRYFNRPWQLDTAAAEQINLVNVLGYCYRTQNGDGYRKLLSDRLRQAIELSRAGSATVPVTFALGVHTSHGSLTSAREIDEYLQDAAKAGIDGMALFTWGATAPFLAKLQEAESISRFAQTVEAERQ